MLKQDGAADENQNDTADKLGTRFVARSENISDLQAYRGNDKGGRADNGDRRPNIHVGKKR